MASACDLEVYPTKIKVGCLSGRKVVLHDSENNLPREILKLGTEFHLKK